MEEEEQEYETDYFGNSRTRIKVLLALFKRRASNWGRLIIRPAGRNDLRNESDDARIQ